MSRVMRLRPLITRVARQYGQRPALIAAMVQVESGGDPLAINPEPTFLAAHKRAIGDYVRHCGNSLAYGNFQKSGVAWATSYGLMQIMWPVAFERGLRNPWPTVLCRPETGLLWGCKQLAWLLEQTDDETKAVAAYNGGLGRPNYTYAMKVQEAMHTYDW